MIRFLRRCYRWLLLRTLRNDIEHIDELLANMPARKRCWEHERAEALKRIQAIEHDRQRDRGLAHA
jgi:hypothetical protein